MVLFTSVQKNKEIHLPNLKLFQGSNFFLEIIARMTTPIPRTKNTRYGVSSPKDCVIGPPIVGPIAHPTPKTVSYAPIIFPEIFFEVLLRIISKVNGKEYAKSKSH